MKILDLEKHNIAAKNIYRNLCPAKLVEIALKTEPCRLTDTGALLVETGKYTGRSPKDRYIVDEPSSNTDIAWGKENHSLSSETYEVIYQCITEYLTGKDVYVFDGFAGADPKYRVAIRVINEYASQNLFMNNMLIRPTEAELKNFAEDFTLICAPGLKLDAEKLGINSEAAVVINFGKKTILIAGTKYNGEMKKSVFSVMNYLLPKAGVLGMHCSANMALDGSNNVALFFGLSGTGKTTLSAAPDRGLIGDDEHGWSDNGIFNIEGGCYAKCIDLNAEKEPEIYGAIKHGAVVENVIVDEDRHPDYSDKSLTENTRVSYPISFIPNRIDSERGGHPKTIIFLTADAFGVLPPISKLSIEQAVYYFILGYTSKVAGTERGIIEPVATFSTCFGAPFLPLAPSVYADMLSKKIHRWGGRVFLVNTGWTGGGYGVGKRMNLKDTRAMVTAACNGDFDLIPHVVEPFFGLSIPTSCPNVDPSILNPKNSWTDKEAYNKAAEKLASLFAENFKQYADIDEEIREAGPTEK